MSIRLPHYRQDNISVVAFARLTNQKIPIVYQQELYLFAGQNSVKVGLLV